MNLRDDCCCLTTLSVRGEYLVVLLATSVEMANGVRSSERLAASYISIKLGGIPPTPHMFSLDDFRSNGSFQELSAVEFYKK